MNHRGIDLNVFLDLIEVSNSYQIEMSYIEVIHVY